MNTINSIGANQPLQQVLANPIARSTPSTEDSQSTASDIVDITNTNGSLSTSQTGGIRTDLVNSIRSQIDAGTYETDDKLDVATNRLLDDITGS